MKDSNEIMASGNGHKTYAMSTRKDILTLFDRPYSKILDVGCATGNTMQMLLQNGLASEAVGVEPFSEAAEIARRKGLVVHNTSIEQAIGKIEENEFMRSFFSMY